VLGVIAIYGFGVTQTFPTFLLVVALGYPIVGFIVGYLHPPTLRESGEAILTARTPERR
jgi:hypothetical protein